ncbi:TspO/MBR family protein [Paenisporosarcina indica]|uniref:TspO/MBR family protein n=1 Tax=Paenisporosarcina indica TaxID=650093 RepID=UPI000950306C|nr:TspO/MBR family protein [Paenisporosarcina indica]
MGRFALMVISLIGVIVVNALANILPINNQTTGDISNRLPVLFKPAGYVFSIWIVIYVLLVIWLMGMWKKNKQRDASYQKQSNLFVISCILNIAWIYFWHYEQFLLTVVIMIGFLITLLILYLSYPITDQHLLSRLPISIYLGWIFVATIVNISYVLTVYQWDGWGLSDPLWAVIMMTIGTAVALHIRFHYFDVWVVYVFIWAYIGIIVHNGLDELLVSTASLFLCAVMLVGIIFIKKRPTA